MKDGRCDKSYPRVEKESCLLEAAEWRVDKRFIVLCFAVFISADAANAIAHRLNCISVFIARAMHISFVRACRSRRENA
jgi:hypothetical protein